MSKNPKDIQRKEETGTEELEQQVELALERVLSRQLAPVMLLRCAHHYLYRRAKEIVRPQDGGQPRGIAA